MGAGEERGTQLTLTETGVGGMEAREGEGRREEVQRSDGGRPERLEKDGGNATTEAAASSQQAAQRS